MALILEDGTAPEGANSYASLDMCIAYCLERGLTFVTSPSSPGEEALIRATGAIDATYRGGFPGYRTHGRDQSLEWPRTGAYDNSDWLIDSDVIPQELINATMEAAVRELASPGAMMPDLERGGAIHSIQAGSVGITYAASASARTTYSIIDGLLSGLLVSGVSGHLSGRSERA